MASDTNDLQRSVLLQLTNFVATTLSAAGCIWLLNFYKKQAEPRAVSLKFIAAMAVSDLIFSVANYMSAVDSQNTMFCTLEAIIRESSSLFSIHSATCIALLCYNVAVYGNSYNQQAFFTRATYVGIILSAGMALLPSITTRFGYGKGPMYCWISYVDTPVTQTDRLVLLMLFEGIPLTIALGTTAVMYIRLIRKLRELPEELLNLMDIRVYRLVWYPMVLFISFLPSMIDGIVNIYHDINSETLEAIHLILTHSIGLTNTLVYGLQQKLYHETNQVSPPQSERHDSITGPSNDESGEYISHKPRANRGSLVQELIKARAFSE